MDEELFEDGMSADEAADLYLKNAAKEDDEDQESDESTEGQEEEEEESTEDTSDEPEGEDEEGEEEGEPNSNKTAEIDDEAEVKVQVDGKELAVKIKDLKRLAGQEAALTQKSQAVSAAQRSIETQSLGIAAILDGRMKTAAAKVAKYKDVDLFTAQRNLDPDEFDALRAAKAAAEAEYATVEAETKTFMSTTLEARKNILRERAKVALPIIKKAIPDWSDELYGKIRQYAVGEGMSIETVNEIVEPGAIILMHKAMQFDAAKAKASEVVQKKVVKTAKKVVKKSESPADYKGSKVKALEKRAAMSGDVDDIAELYLARQKNN